MKNTIRITKTINLGSGNKVVYWSNGLVQEYRNNVIYREWRE